jgi:hypothetical protein
MLSVGVVALSLPTFLPQSEFIMYLPIVREGHSYQLQLDLSLLCYLKSSWYVLMPQNFSFADTKYKIYVSILCNLLVDTKTPRLSK